MGAQHVAMETPISPQPTAVLRQDLVDLLKNINIIRIENQRAFELNEELETRFSFFRFNFFFLFLILVQMKQVFYCFVFYCFVFYLYFTRTLQPNRASY